MISWDDEISWKLAVFKWFEGASELKETLVISYCMVDSWPKYYLRWKSAFNLYDYFSNALKFKCIEFKSGQIQCKPKTQIEF